MRGNRTTDQSQVLSATKLFKNFIQLAVPPADQTRAAHLKKGRKIQCNQKKTQQQSSFQTLCKPESSWKWVTTTNQDNHLCLLPFGEVSKEPKLLNCKPLFSKHDLLKNDAFTTRKEELYLSWAVPKSSLLQPPRLPLVSRHCKDEPIVCKLEEARMLNEQFNLVWGSFKHQG